MRGCGFRPFRVKEHAFKGFALNIALLDLNRLPEVQPPFFKNGKDPIWMMTILRKVTVAPVTPPFFFMVV